MPKCRFPPLDVQSRENRKFDLSSADRRDGLHEQEHRDQQDQHDDEQAGAGGQRARRYGRPAAVSRAEAYGSGPEHRGFVVQRADAGRLAEPSGSEAWKPRSPSRPARRRPSAAAAARPHPADARMGRRPARRRRLGGSCMSRSDIALARSVGRSRGDGASSADRVHRCLHLGLDLGRQWRVAEILQPGLPACGGVAEECLDERSGAGARVLRADDLVGDQNDRVRAPDPWWCSRA